ncbi:hypothetical protein AUR64_11730 [Haloprofundus marisrubri]|uniref:DUF8215 domain-containing protein n=1 Tax=Haloprofundus marisrubri TaxID=1514971 RepID=A0A0W1RA80_9EURY|nr:hypothetical protein [Haloprofundus marisrubri]KTG10246.1 hypothetical protein AUR64_11730 [Haloprofundus marisrubri]
MASPSRGTDPATEQRQLRPREENDGYGRLLESLFSGGGAVAILTIPAMFWILSVTAGRSLFAAADVVFVFAVGFVSLVLSVSALSGDWTSFGPAWPPRSYALAAFRAVGYNVTLWAATTLALLPALPSGPRVGVGAVSGEFVAVVVVAALPPLAVLALVHLCHALYRFKTASSGF